MGLFRKIFIDPFRGNKIVERVAEKAADVREDAREMAATLDELKDGVIDASKEKLADVREGAADLAEKAAKKVRGRVKTPSSDR